jgi:hypothetical protein
MSTRPHSNYNSIRHHLSLNRSNINVVRPASAQRISILNSQIVRPQHRSIISVPHVTHSVYIPVYPIIEIQPVYYNVNVPIKLSELHKARLASSTVMETVPNDHQPDILIRENNPHHDKMKFSTSTFDRSKMQLSLLSNRSKNREPPIHP